MRISCGLILLAALTACSGGMSKSILSDAAEERRLRDALQDIEERVKTGNLPKIQFEFDKAEITPESYTTLEQIVLILKSTDRLKLMIQAHTDAIGSDDYNMDLSERRANAVKSHLASKGVPPPSMRFHGYGASRPLADNATDEGRAKNRRVEFHVTTRDWNSVY